MGVDHMVITVTPQQHIFNAEEFLRQARQQWPGCRTLRLDHQGRFADSAISIDPSNQHPFSARHFPSNQMVSTDADPQVAAEVAAWVRSFHPDPGLILWFIDEGASGHTVLFPGITAEEVLAGWVDHAEHDPEEDYPDYLK